MSKYQLIAEQRSDFGKEKAKKLRRTGRFPAIVYGADSTSVPLSLDTHETELVLGRIHGEKVLVDLQYGKAEEKVFVRNIQRDPVSNRLLHVDFFRVDLNREMETQVPVFAVGTPAGVKDGGLLEAGLRQIAVRCLPTKVPPHIDVAVSALEMGHSLHVRDLAAIDGVTILTAPDAVLFAVVGRSKTMEDAAPVSAAVPAEGAAAPAEGAAAAAPAAPAAKS